MHHQPAIVAGFAVVGEERFSRRPGNAAWVSKVTILFNDLRFSREALQMSDEIFTKFEARVTVEGPFSSDGTIYDPKSLLEVALQHALVSMPAEAVSKLVADVTTSMLHSLSCKRRRNGEVVRLEDQDPDGYNGLYLIAAGRGDPTDCVLCGNRLCNEWPTLLELSPAGVQTGDYAYHVSECQMLDPSGQDQRALETLGRSVLSSIREALNSDDSGDLQKPGGDVQHLFIQDEIPPQAR